MTEARLVTVELHKHSGEYGPACKGCGKRLTEVPAAAPAEGLREALHGAWMLHANDPEWHKPLWDEVDRTHEFDGCDVNCMDDIADRAALARHESAGSE